MPTPPVFPSPRLFSMPDCPARFPAGRREEHFFLFPRSLLCGAILLVPTCCITVPSLLHERRIHTTSVMQHTCLVPVLAAIGDVGLSRPASTSNLTPSPLPASVAAQGPRRTTRTSASYRTFNAFFLARHLRQPCGFPLPLPVHVRRSARCGGRLRPTTRVYARRGHFQHGAVTVRRAPTFLRRTYFRRAHFQHGAVRAGRRAPTFLRVRRVHLWHGARHGAAGSLFRRVHIRHGACDFPHGARHDDLVWVPLAQRVQLPARPSQSWLDASGGGYTW